MTFVLTESCSTGIQPRNGWGRLPTTPQITYQGISASFGTCCMTETRSFFRSTLLSRGVRPLTLPPRSPNLNAFAERWVRSVKQECLSRLILFGERSLRTALTQFIAHYNYASYCPPRYVADKSRSPWLSTANTGARLCRRPRSTNCAEATFSSPRRLRIQGPSGSGCSASISPRSIASLSRFSVKWRAGVLR
jgi:hypothetical protein